MTKPFQASSGTGIAHPGPQGRFGRGPTCKPAPQQTQEKPADRTSPTEQMGKTEPPKQAK